MSRWFSLRNHYIEQMFKSQVRMSPLCPWLIEFGLCYKSWRDMGLEYWKVGKVKTCPYVWLESILFRWSEFVVRPPPPSSKAPPPNHLWNVFWVWSVARIYRITGINYYIVIWGRKDGIHARGMESNGQVWDLPLRSVGINIIHGRGIR
jgi:hypothetical protein